MMKSVFLLIILSLFFVGCNSDEPKLSSLANFSSGNISAPYITNVTTPTTGVKILNDIVEFYVTFNKPVTVIGTPRVSFVTESGGAHAYYADGSGTNTLHFVATIAAGLIDDNGITLSPIITLNGGSIYDVLTNEDARLNFTPPPTFSILINTADPVITSITAPANGNYVTGSTVRFLVNFNARVCGSVSPRLSLNIGGSPKFATWVNEGVCGTTMKFDYTVGAGESDADGIQLTGASINLAIVGSGFKDFFTDNANLTYTAASYPLVFVNLPAVQEPGTAPASATYKIGDVLTFAVKYDQNVSVTLGTPSLALDINGVTKTANYDATSNNTTSIVFKYTIVEGDYDMDAGGITIGSVTKNGASFMTGGANVNPANMFPAAVIKVDGVRPVISSIGTPANGLYLPPSNVSATVNWSESVTFVGGSPTLKMQMDSDLTSKTAAASGHTGTVTTFSYPVQVGDADFNGMSIPANAFTLPGGVSVIDQAGNLATVLTSAFTTTQAKIVPDGVQHWYDPTNSASFGTSAGNSLTQLKDLIGTANFSISDPPKWDGTPKRINFDDNLDYMTVGPFANFDKIYFVMETTAFIPYQLVYAVATSEIFVNFQGGIVTAYNTCGDCAKYFDGDSWELTANPSGNFGTYVSNKKYIIMLDYQGLTNVELIFGSGFKGYIHEIFVVGPGANPTNNAASFLRALQAKHSGAILP